MFTPLAPQAITFIKAEVAAGYTMRAADIAAVHRLVLDLTQTVRDGGNTFTPVYSRMAAVYPFIGSTQTSHKFNLVDPRDLDAAFRLVDHGSPAHAATGVTFNGSSSYQDTRYNPTAQASPLLGIGFYCRTAALGSGTSDLGGLGNSGGETTLWTRYTDNRVYSAVGNTSGETFAANTVTLRWWSQQRNTTASAAANVKTYHDAALFTSANGLANTTSNVFLYFGCFNSAGVSPSFGPSPQSKEWAFAVILKGLFTDTEHAQMFNAIQNYQTILGRQV